MKKDARIATFIFLTTAGIMAAISIWSFVAALSWLNKPFAGFLVYRPPFVDSLGIRDWPGKKAGLQYLDRIVAVDGDPVLQGQDVVRMVREKQPGTPVRYLVESKREMREVTVPVTIFGIRDFLLVFLITFSCGVLLYALGIIAYLLKPNIRSSWVFLGLCFSLGTYVATAYECESTYYFARLNACSLCFFPATFLHLGLIFPDRKRFLTRVPSLEYLVYFPAVLLALLFVVYFSTFQEILHSGALPWLPGYRELGAMGRVFSLFSAIALLVLLVHAVYRASTTAARQRARMILFGVTVAFVPPGLVMAAVHFLKVNIPWNFLVFFVIFFPASIAYSIVRHNLFDADVIIRRTVGYTVVTAIVVGGYVGVSVTLNVFLEKYQVAQSQAFPILFTLGVILIFNPLRNRVQAVVDRLFFRKEYDYGAVVDKVSRAITSLLNLGEVMKRLTRTFVEDMFVNTTSVMLFNAAAAEYRVYLADGERKSDVEDKAFRSDGPLIQIIEGRRSELTRFDVMEDPKYRAVSSTCEAAFEAVHATLMIPLVFQDKLIGLLNLGEKKSGKAFNRQDLDLLYTIANQGAVAIENARLFQENLEKQRMEEELNIAHDLQMSMLPASCPQVPGFAIAATSIPAREVGGDFFDFIEMGERKLGFVIGDVTGKSVSGALVMAASRSVFRMLSETEVTVGEIMARANRRTKKDIKTGMFVALLYAVLDPRNGRLSLCSAGQTQPIHLSARTGEAILVDTEGDTFPLGILEEADYRETQLKLAAGDKVIFYTDGIVEAMNKDEQIFGFDRLLEVVREGRSMSADSLLQAILDKVNRFSGGAAQHDDLTVIVVAAE
jgi:serine phosphatase RsbU (regulator of sigma subunit)